MTNYVHILAQIVIVEIRKSVQWAYALASTIIIIYYVYRTQSTKYKKYTHKTYNRHQEVQIKSTA